MPRDPVQTGPANVSAWILYAMVGAGIVLRLLLLLTAENRLDADESVVGVMALDILEGRSFPMFFYGGAYNGGGAWEAYLAVLPFAVFGPSALAVKLCVLALWSAAALLFADLCRRSLPTGQAMLTLSFFCIATPFFLEWSLKARGGFAEVVLFSVGLLWLARPRRLLDRRTLLRSFLIGIVSGIGVWGSEMLLAMIPCAAGWFLLGCDPSRRGHACAALLGGFFIGSLPLLFFNLMHDWQHVGQSVVVALLQRGSGGLRPLDLAQLGLSARFVLGPAWILLLLGVAVSGVRLGVRSERWNLGHVALAHFAIFVASYWLSGLRYLQLPPSRALYALYPSLALLLGAAVYLPTHRGKTSRGVVAISLVLWFGAVAVPTASWMRSGTPREHGSWRGSWALTDGDRLYRRLARDGVQRAYTNVWTTRSLAFSIRSARYRDPRSPPLAVTSRIPASPPRPRTRVAIVLQSGSALQRHVERRLLAHRVPYRRSEWDNLVIFSEMDSSHIHTGVGLPQELATADWKRLPADLDGFN